MSSSRYTPHYAPTREEAQKQFITSAKALLIDALKLLQALDVLAHPVRARAASDWGWRWYRDSLIPFIRVACKAAGCRAFAYLDDDDIINNVDAKGGD